MEGGKKLTKKKVCEKSDLSAMRVFVNKP
jgi:hypothetical protein